MVGLLALNAAVIGFAVLVLLLARSPWVFPQSGRAWRLRGVIAWLLPALFLWWPDVARDYAPLLPTLAAAAFIVGAALVIHHYRATLRHSSQATRLLAAFLAMMLPSVVLYPSLVDAATRARRQLVESRYAPEVMNQRQDVRLKLQQALVEIDRIARPRRTGARERSGADRPAAHGCGVPGVVADQPGEPADDVERRAPQRVGRHGQPLCA